MTGPAKPEGEERPMKTITLKAATESIPEVTAFVDRELEAVECSIRAQMQIDVAIDEIFSNIAYYAYGPGGGDATVQFRFDASKRTVTIDFIDGGAPFDPLKKPDPNVKAGIEEREIGGLGIFLVKKTMDEMRYRREDGKNVLTIIKMI